MRRQSLIALLLSLVLSGCTKPSSSEAPTLSSEPSISQPIVVTPLSIDVTKDSEKIYEIIVHIDENITLNANVLPLNASQSVQWTINDEEIATISDTGILTGKALGETILTVSATDHPHIQTSIFVTVKAPVVQTGVGSGTSIDDPIFKGNEGEEPLEIYFLETFHIYADSLLLKKGNVEILIDGGWVYDGEMNKALINSLVPDGRLDMVIATHGHSDHYDAIPELVSDIPFISSFLDYGPAGGENAGYKRLVNNRIASDNAYYYGAYDSVNGLNGAANRYYFTPEFYVDVLDTGAYGSSVSSSSGNDQSLALMFNYHNFKFFTAGDLTSSGELYLLNQSLLPEVSLYKPSHHGSHGSNEQSFLNKLNPYMVAITASRAGQYGVTPGPASPTRTYNLDGKGGHPAAAAIERIYKAPRISLNLNVYWNMPNGTMKFTTHGGATDVTMEGTPTRHGYYDLTLTSGLPIWNESLNNFENKVTGEEQKKFHETKVFAFREYESYLPAWVNR